MGTACSVARSQSETNVSGGSSGKADQSSPGRVPESEKPLTQRVAANGDLSTRTGVEQQASTPVAGPSFQWLVSSPVVFQNGPRAQVY